MLSTKSPDTQLISFFNSFFNTLKEEYGFDFGISEASRALESVSDFTDVEDVLYSTQSSLCHNSKQYAQYERIFCQKFLNYAEIIPPKNRKKSREEKNFVPTQTSASLRKRIQKMLKEENDLREKLEDTAQDTASTEEAWHNASRKYTQLAHQLRTMQAKAQKMDLEESCLAGNEEYQRLVEKLEVPGLFQKLLCPILEQGEGTKIQAVEVKNLLAIIPAVKKDKAEMRRCMAFIGTFMTFQENVYQISSNLHRSSEYLKLLKDIEELKKQVKKAESQVTKLHKEYAQARENLEKLQKEYNIDLTAKQRVNREYELTSAYEHEQQVLISSIPSRQHRELFVGGHNAVIRPNAIKNLLNTPLEELKKEELDKLRGYIRTNAKAFRQTLRRNLATKNQCQVDIKQTISKACKTGGEITKLYFQKPSKSKAKVVILTDISGSCHAGAVLALNYMGLMGEVFPGGCDMFVFVNKLVPVNQYFQKYPVSDAVDTVNVLVPTRGLYSNYGPPLNSLRQDYAGLFRKDTTVIILGDCRSNAYEPGIESLKWIAEHSKCVHILNPESSRMWGSGDSVVNRYQRIRNVDVQEIRSTGMLLDFLASCGKTN